MKIGRSMHISEHAAICKLLLLALNGGRDEISGDQIAPSFEPYNGEYIEYEAVWKNSSLYRIGSRFIRRYPEYYTLHA
jgi:formate C-acetyltransferase